MPRGKQRKGLQVRHSDSVVKPNAARNGMRRYTPMPSGWYIFASVCGVYRPLLDLRFIREKDAIRGCAALTAAGLDCEMAMKRAGLAVVKQVATEWLQW